MKWFITWNQPEYKEWAKKTFYGYLLLIIRRERKQYLCAKAKLLINKTGLPEFKLIKQKYNNNYIKAINNITRWKKD